MFKHSQRKTNPSPIDISFKDARLYLIDIQPLGKNINSGNSYVTLQLELCLAGS